MSAAAVSVLMYDETPGSGRSPPVKLELVSERVTVRQLIESRDAQFGALAGCAWAEGFVVREPVVRPTLLRKP